MSQLLMDFAAAPSTAAPTSREAARRISKATVDAQRTRILALLRRTPAGLTRQEIEQQTGIHGDAVRPRVWAMIDAGEVYEQGTRPTLSSRPAAIVRAAQPQGAST